MTYGPAVERRRRFARNALETLGEPGATLFLHGRHAGLDARPIDVAGESDRALAEAEAALLTFGRTVARLRAL